MPPSGSSDVYRFLFHHLDRETFMDKLEWADKSRLMFQLIWTHGNNRSSMNDDWDVIREYEKTKGRMLRYVYCDYLKAKHNFKMSLKKVKVMKEYRNGHYFVFKMDPREVRKAGLLMGSVGAADKKAVMFRDPVRALTDNDLDCLQTCLRASLKNKEDQDVFGDFFEDYEAFFAFPN